MSSRRVSRRSIVSRSMRFCSFDVDLRCAPGCGRRPATPSYPSRLHSARVTRQPPPSSLDIVLRVRLMLCQPHSRPHLEKTRMIYELRTYHCVPGRLPALLKRFENTTMRLFERHGFRQLGFWTVAIGESNQDLIYILQWDSLADREKKFVAFQSDPEWIEARRLSEESGPLVNSITNAILTPTAFSAAR